MILILIGVVLWVGIAAWVAKHRSRPTIQPLDVEAFRRLMGQEDEVFLHSISLFASLQLKCQRIWLRRRYIRRVADNARAFVQLGASVPATPNSEIRQTASKIVDLGTRLRFQCLVASIKLGVEFVFPFLPLTSTRLAQEYQTLRKSVWRLNALRSQRAFAPVVIVSVAKSHRRFARPKRQKNERDVDDLQEKTRTELWGQEINRAASRF